MRLACPHCDAEVTIADRSPGTTADCPRCQKAFRLPMPGVPEARIIDRPVEPGPIQPPPPPPSAPRPTPSEIGGAAPDTAASSSAADSALPVSRLYVAPTWMVPGGFISICLGAAAALATFAVNSGVRSEGMAFLSVVANPFVFVPGMLGVYWLYRAMDSGTVEICPHCQMRLHRKQQPVVLLKCPRCRKRYRPV